MVANMFKARIEKIYTSKSSNPPTFIKAGNEETKVSNINLKFFCFSKNFSSFRSLNDLKPVAALKAVTSLVRCKITPKAEPKAIMKSNTFQ